MHLDGKTVLTHRASYTLQVGPIPAGLNILHSCNNRRCVEITHLRAGTQKENMKDRDKANRRIPPKGSLNGQSKLTEEDIPKIRRLSAEGMYQHDIARLFGVRKATICFIITGRSWAHVSPSVGGHLPTILKRENLMESKIVNVFGQFAVELDGVPHLYETEKEARAALVMHEHSTTLEARIDAYCEDAGAEGKVAVARGNIIRAFLIFEATTLAGEEEVEEEAA